MLAGMAVFRMPINSAQRLFPKNVLLLAQWKPLAGPEVWGSRNVSVPSALKGLWLYMVGTGMEWTDYIGYHWRRHARPYPALGQTLSTWLQRVPRFM